MRIGNAFFSTPRGGATGTCRSGSSSTSRPSTEAFCLYQIGLQSDPGYGIEKLYTPTFWDLAREISSAKMFIGVDSGPSWIAACYPDIVANKVRVKLPDGEGLIEDWVPLEIDRIHSHWDDRCFHIHNVTEDDRGFTSSFKRL